jgi:hypothetical protein
MDAAGVRSFASRRVPLPDDRTLVVRLLRNDDVGALAALYGELSEDDLYRRFFQAHVPPRYALERMAKAEARGDIALVAELVLPDGRRQLVGETAGARLPDGNAELALTVSPSARGWMGPYLLGVLCDVAAERGIPNLEADVLLDNRPMLALVHHRGYATMGHSEQPAIIRVVFSTTGPVPTWPPRCGRPRVLVEAPGARWHAEGAARAAGFDLLVCPGPGARWSRCPAVKGDRCPLAGQADLVVEALEPGSDAGRALWRAHRSVHADRLLYLDRPGTVVDDLRRLLEETRSRQRASAEVR